MLNSDREDMVASGERLIDSGSQNLAQAGYGSREIDALMKQEPDEDSHDPGGRREQ